MHTLGVLGMDIEYFEEFEAIAQLSSYRAAAEVLHISKSSLSKHIDALEEACGFKLFANTTPISLTPAGRIFFESLAEIKSVYKEQINKCRWMNKNFPRQFLVGLPSARDNANHAIREMMNSLPNDLQKVYSYREVSNDDLLSMVIREEIDAGVYYSCYGKDKLTRIHDGIDLEFKLISQEPLLAMMSPLNPLSKKEALSSSDLRNSPIFLAVTQNGSMRKTLIDSLFTCLGSRPRYQLSYTDNLDRLRSKDFGDSINIITESVLPFISNKGSAFGEYVVLPIDVEFKQLVYFVYKKSNSHSLMNVLEAWMTKQFDC
jgi:DNA-binding transcriptional LysR family regulator